MRDVRTKLLSLAIAALAIPLAACLPGPRSAPVVDHARQEVRLSGVVQKTDAPRMSDFGSHFSALLGCKGGKVDEYFVFLVDAWTPEVYKGLLELGARPRATFGSGGTVQHAGQALNLVDQGYMQGDPLLIYIEWDTPKGTMRRAYEDFFIEKIVVDGKEVEKPWTPHFILHGSGILNDTRTGCIACTHDCPGGIVANNQFPLNKPIPVLKANWDLLPKPGTRVTVVLRPVPSAPPRTEGQMPPASPPAKAAAPK